MSETEKLPPIRPFASWAQCFASGFGSGCFPVAPGTAGTLAALLPWFILIQLSFYAYWLIIIIAILFGIYCCDRAAKELSVHDHGGIVWDEFVGLWITLSVVPITWYWILAGFILFRFFDVLKPWPIRWLDNSVDGGLGIMIDDILAGIFAAFFLLLLIHWLN